jgi:type IV pilus assembly protein PilP
VKRNSRQKKRSQKLKGSNVLWGFIFLVFILYAGGCGGGTTPLPVAKKEKQAAIEKKADPKTLPAQKEPEPKEAKEYVYNPSGKPDPFKPFIQLTTVKDSSRTVPLTPLQRYEINQLKLVAIITAPDGNHIALVEDSSGKGYFVKKGTWIGNNDGKVTKILRDKVLVEESYQDIFGKTKTSEISLLLHRTEEGGEL